MADSFNFILAVIICSLVSFKTHQTPVKEYLQFQTFQEKAELALAEQLTINLQDNADSLREKTDPESYMNVSQLITSKGYPCEDYTVQTQDGFLLSVQRIPHGLKSKSTGRHVVFLQHGLLCSSASWVINLANESLAFILADAGYDVWLGNVRGNTYGRRHIQLKPDSDAFWNWTMDEMAQYDLPAMVDFALAKSKQSQLYYVGHSQGTWIGFAQFSHDQALAKKIKMFFALAPVTTVGYTLSPLRLFKFSKDQELYELFGRKDFMPNTGIIKLLARTLCAFKYLRGICTTVIFLFGGIDVQQFNMTRLPVMMTHTPAGTSCKNMIHWLQLIRSYKFDMYDYGTSALNQEHYGRDTPPPYNVTDMKTRVALFTGGHDWLADPKDVDQLIPKLHDMVSHTYMPDYNHFDFIWGMNAPSKVYAEIMELMRKNT